jgi:hypothetical protein
MRTGRFESNHPSLQEYLQDKQYIEDVTIVIQWLEEEYLQNKKYLPDDRTEDIIQELQFWYEELHQMNNKIYF